MTEAEAKWLIIGYRGLRVGHSKGYLRCKSPMHPNADAEGYVYTHVYRATLVLGRGLQPNEMVHHIDGDPANNTNSNLLICTKRYHYELHIRLRDSPDWPQFSRKDSRPKCLRCGVAISYASRSGLCEKHYWDLVRTEPRRCRVSRCTERAGSRSGLCLGHVKYRGNKRRFCKDWDFAS